MNVDLQIAIPTFNRETAVNDLVQRLLVETSDISQNIAIIVSDNSDNKNINLYNQSQKNEITYTWNETNIGFARNVAKCLSYSLGKFTLLLSDDDEVDFCALRELIRKLSSLDISVVGIAIPCVMRSLQGSTNLDISLKAHYHSTKRFEEVVESTRIPFDFLSSFVIKTELLRRRELKSYNFYNDYFHSLVYCSSLTASSKIYIYPNAIVRYKSPEIINWSLVSLLKSKEEISDSLWEKHNIKINKKRIKFGILSWALQGRLGSVNIRCLKDEFPKLIKLCFTELDFRTVVIGVLLISPPLFSRILYSAILSVTSVEKNNASKLMIFKTIYNSLNRKN